MGLTPARGALATLAERIERLRHTLASPKEGSPPGSGSRSPVGERDGGVAGRGWRGDGEDGEPGSPALVPMRMTERGWSAGEAVDSATESGSRRAGARLDAEGTPTGHAAVGGGMESRGTPGWPAAVHTPVGASELEAARRARERLQARLRRDGVVLGGVVNGPGLALPMSPLGRTSSPSPSLPPPLLSSSSSPKSSSSGGYAGAGSLEQLASAVAWWRAEVQEGRAAAEEWETVEAAVKAVAMTGAGGAGRVAEEVRDTLHAMHARMEAIQARMEAAEARVENVEARNAALESENEKLARAFEIADRSARELAARAAVARARGGENSAEAPAQRETLSALDEALRGKLLLQKAGQKGVLRTPLAGMR